MSIKEQLLKRSGSKCELCGMQNDLDAYEVKPSEESILLCNICQEQVKDNSNIDENHWRCLNDSMWSEIPAVQVMAYRMLKKIQNQDLLDMLYLEDDVKKWADADNENKTSTLDANGVKLQAGDSVTIIKDLEVKGAGFTAKRGTAVRNIALADNPEQIEGRVNGTRIVLLTKFLKKA